MYHCEHCCKHFSRIDSLTRHYAASCFASKWLKGGSFFEISRVKKAGYKYPKCREIVDFGNNDVNPLATDKLVNGTSVETFS